MKISDLHTHSINSFDAQNSVEEMCQSAVDNGLYAIAITDHCEAPMISQGHSCEYGCFDERIPKSVSDTLIAKQKFGNNLKVLCGLELGEPMHDQELTKHALSYGNFDFILASVHNIRNYDDFYFLDYKNVDISTILKQYFDELAETASFEHFDSLAHLTYPLRYIKSSLGVLPDLSSYSKQIDDIFNILITNNKALEINVSGLFKGLETTLPDKAIIKRFKELGGKYITLGTDAHSTEFVGKGLEKGIEIAKECGFTQYTIFENHNPILIDFD